MTISRRRTGLRWLFFGLLVLLAAHPAIAKLTLSGVTAVNVTPSSFSVVANFSSVVDSNTTISVSVFADSAGVTNLAGQLGVELYPLQTGSPATTNSYDRRLNQQNLRQNTMSQALIHARVSGCTPGTTYYYSLLVARTNGQSAVWPTNGPLPSVVTPTENAFVLQSEQLVISLGQTSPNGAIVLLANSNTPSILAAVVGDGAGTNQAFFSINELLAASGNTNVLPNGTVVFTASVRGSLVGPVTQTYSLGFASNFVVSASSQLALGSFVALSLGSNAVLAGQSVSIPINLLAATSVTNFSFILNVPTNRFSNISLQALVPQVASASVNALGTNTLLLAFGAGPGQNLLGNQLIAQVNFATVSNQVSAFLPLIPQALHGTNNDASAISQSTAQPGRLVVVGQQSLLEALLAPDGERSLALYGHPGESYQIQSSTNLSKAGNWLNLMRVPLTNIMEQFSLDSSPPLAFYQAYSFTADPPLLEAHRDNQNRSLLTYGIPGTNYILLSATNLSRPVWSPVLSYTLTNSFQFITSIGNGQTQVFYRLQRP